jgi:LacI family transcriptional regulator
MLVGVWFNVPGGPFYGPVAAGIRKELARWGYHAVFEHGGVERGAERRGIEDLVRKNLDGFIVAPSDKPADDHGPLTELIDRDVPVVLVDRLLPGQDADLVTTNGERGGEEIVEYLIELGHRRIGFIGPAGLSTIDARLEGCRLAMQDHGLPIDDAWIRLTDKTAFDYGREAAEEILAMPPDRRPTAVFGANDATAQTVAKVARERSLRIPEDLSVAGFDNIDVAGFEHIGIGLADAIQLTTYAQPKEHMGQQAARLLMRRIQEPSGRPVIVLLEGELVIRSSTAPPSDSGGEEADVPAIDRMDSGS